MSTVSDNAARRDRIAAAAIEMRRDIAEKFSAERSLPPEAKVDAKLREHAAAESRRVRETR